MKEYMVNAWDQDLPYLIVLVDMLRCIYKNIAKFGCNKFLKPSEKHKNLETETET